MAEPAGSVWTEREIELIVADYLDMLREELAGRGVVKVERNRALQAMLGRSKGSIEYKHQNISAVMQLLGLPFIRGYKPARNYQRTLIESVQEAIAELGLQDRLADPFRAMQPPPGGLEYGPPPAVRDRAEIPDPAVRALLRKWDPAERDARARALGEAGEGYLFQSEKNRLSAAGQDRLAEQVRWVSRDEGDGAGYDILSFSRNGEKRLLEVKTTNGPADTPFWISRNELRVSNERSDHYRLARVYSFSQQPAAYLLKPPLSDHVRLEATQYKALF